MPDDPPPLPNCPRCGEKMRLLHKLLDPKDGGREVRVYGCGPCDEVRFRD
jgi:hypothetical protein